MLGRAYAYGRNHFDLDPDLPTVLSTYWPEWEAHRETLRDFGALVGSRVYEVLDLIDRQGGPELVMHDVDGNRIDRALLLPEHRALLQELAWMNRPPYEGQPWQFHFALGYLLADPGLYCTLIVTNQTAYALHKYLPSMATWKEDLLSGRAWGATWMTETHAGSDLGANKTIARKEGEVWRLYGDHKYFASNAGIADAAVVTARPEGSRPGPKGIALFFVPRLDRQGRLNFQVRRFKKKLATRAVPTGEVEFHGSEAYLVGKPEWGIYITLETLTVSRLANAAGAMGLGHKARMEAVLRAQRRTAFGKLLAEHPLMRWDLVDMAVRQAGGLALVFRAVEAFQKAWHETPPYSPAYHYARFLSHLTKNRTADHAIAITHRAMEVFGGLGFLEDYPIARLHREALVLSIWEGTSNIQALDLLEAMQRKQAHEPFLEDMVERLEAASTRTSLLALDVLRTTLAAWGRARPEEAQWMAKHALTRLADVAQVALLYSLAEKGGERFAKMAELYAQRFLAREPYPAWAFQEPEIWMLAGE